MVTAYFKSACFNPLHNSHKTPKLSASKIQKKYFQNEKILQKTMMESAGKNQIWIKRAPLYTVQCVSHLEGLFLLEEVDAIFTKGVIEVGDHLLLSPPDG